MYIHVYVCMLYDILIYEYLYVDECIGTEFKEAFDIFDENKDGKISKLELRHSMQKLGQSVDEEELNAMMKSADADGILHKLIIINHISEITRC